jgi:hypothetical protein
MSTENVSPIHRAEPQPPPSEDNPLDVIHDRLNQALGTLDLMFILVTDHGCATGKELEQLEDLRAGTITNALHSTMLRIDEAIAAAEQAAAVRP